MENRAPGTRHLTMPAQLGRKRFDLEWIVPLEPALLTHVAVYDLECVPPHAIADGQGGDEAEALLDLWWALSDRDESADAITFITDAYRRRTGRQPERADLPSHRDASTHER
jgi:hypothetical protein